MTLICTFAPHEDEAARGYYRRLAAANALSSWKELARICEVKESKDNFFARPEHVAASLGLELAWSQKANESDDVARSWGGNRRANSDALCPCCLREDVYLRMAWEHAYVVACPLHEVLLSDSCGGCGGRLKSNREYIEFCSCGHDLRLNETLPAKPAQLWFATLLASNGASSGRWTPRVADVHVDLVVLLVRTLCLFANPLVQPRRQNTAPPKTIRESLEFLRPLEQLLADWPRGFESHVSARIAAGVPKARTLNSLLGKWYEQLRGLASCGPLAPFLEAIGRVAQAEFDGLLGLDSAAEVLTQGADYVLLTEAAKLIGVSRAVLDTQLKNGQLAYRTKLFGTRGHAYEIAVEHVEDIIYARNAWVDETTARILLSVPLSVFKRLAEAEGVVYDTNWRRDLRKGGPVERASLARLVTALRGHGKNRAKGEGEAIALRDLTSRRSNDKKAVVMALRAIIAGEIRPVQHHEHAGGFLYPLDEVSQYFSTPVLEAGLSIQALSKMTGWKWESISHWIDAGYLASNSILLRGQPCRVVLPGQLLDFCRTYKPLADVAKDINTKASALSERMRGIEVIGGKLLPSGARRGGLVRLEDLARIALGKGDAPQQMSGTPVAEGGPQLMNDAPPVDAASW